MHVTEYQILSSSNTLWLEAQVVEKDEVFKYLSHIAFPSCTILMGCLKNTTTVEEQQWKALMGRYFDSIAN